MTIESDFQHAANNGHDFKKGNVEICRSGTTLNVLLHGSNIIKHDYKAIHVNFHGYATTLTKKYMNLYLERYDAGVFTKGGQLMLSYKGRNQPIDSDGWFTIELD